ncbi:MAG: LysR family transcriptional regulator [Prolixibacteraceae bacterium]|jgi:LysR family transcriptional regulator for metE and metH|nr:LysR family transcriptional regulator [Prolixibacteraceae bacterium]
MDIVRIKHLKLLNGLSQNTSMIDVANSLNLTQSALSHQLKDLEERLGAKVVIKKGHRFIFTNVGKRILEASQMILPELELLNSDLNMLMKRQVVRTCTECYTTYPWYPYLVKSMEKKFPKINIQINPSYTSDPLNAVLNGDLDIAITSEKKIGNRLFEKKLFKDKLVAIFSSSHPFVKVKKELLPKDFKFLDFIHFNANNRESIILKDYLAPHGIIPRSVRKLASTELIFEMIKANLGMTVMSKWYVLPYINNKDFKIIDLNGSIADRTWYAYYDQSSDGVLGSVCDLIALSMKRKE